MDKIGELLYEQVYLFFLGDDIILLIEKNVNKCLFVKFYSCSL